MNTYKVLGSISLYSGKVKLTAKQFQRRVNNLIPCGDGIYEITNPPCNFKKGELFGFDGDMPKSFHGIVELVKGKV